MHWLPSREVACLGVEADCRTAGARGIGLFNSNLRGYIPGFVVSSRLPTFSQAIAKKLDKPVRYYLCGEYGDRTARPHYHCCLFGEDFVADRQPFRRTAVGWLYTSQLLADVWGLGHCLIGDLTFESAAYVARYCLKKISGPPAAAHYAGREPEFALMSRRPGIGAAWFHQYLSDVFPSDECVVRGRSCKPPRYYLKRLELADAGMLGEVKARRALAARPRESDLRLAAKQEFARLGLEARAALKEMGYD